MSEPEAAPAALPRCDSGDVIYRPVRVRGKLVDKYGFVKYRIQGGGCYQYIRVSCLLLADELIDHDGYFRRRTKEMAERTLSRLTCLCGHSGLSHAGAAACSECGCQRLVPRETTPPQPYQCADCLGLAEGHVPTYPSGKAPLCCICAGKRADRIVEILTARGDRPQPYCDAWLLIWSAGHFKHPPPSMIRDPGVPALGRAEGRRLVAEAAP